MCIRTGYYVGIDIMLSLLIFFFFGFLTLLNIDLATTACDAIVWYYAEHCDAVHHQKHHHIKEKESKEENHHHHHQ